MIKHVIVYFYKIFKKDRATRLEIYDIISQYIFNGFGFLIIFLMSLMVVFLFWNSMQFIFSPYAKDLFLHTLWNPTGDKPVFGILSMLYGTFLLSCITLIFTFPLGLMISILISTYFSRKLQDSLKFFLEIFTSLPSVVMGFLGLIFVAPYLIKMFHFDSVMNIFSTALILTFFLLPSVISMLLEILNSVSPLMKEAAIALGSSKLEVVIRIVIPSTIRGMVMILLFILSRILGETMIILMISGNSLEFPMTLFHSTRTITSTMAIELGEVVNQSLHYHALFALGSILFAISSVFQWLIKHFERKRI